MQEPERQQDDINRRGVLEEDRIGGGGQFRGPDEQELRQDIRGRCQQFPACPFCGNAAQVDEEYNAREDTASGQDGDGLPAYDFDQQATRAPERGGDGDEEDGLAAIQGGIHGYIYMTLSFFPASWRNNSVWPT